MVHCQFFLHTLTLYTYSDGLSRPGRVAGVNKLWLAACIDVCVYVC